MRADFPFRLSPRRKIGRSEFNLLSFSPRDGHGLITIVTGARVDDSLPFPWSGRFRVVLSVGQGGSGTRREGQQSRTPPNCSCHCL